MVRMTHIFKKRRRAYRGHRKGAARRDIPWHFTYLTWLKLWLESGKWLKRGRRSGEYVMARFGDRGPYSSKNVKIILHVENTREAHIGNKYGIGNKSMLGQKHSNAARKKMSAALIGNKNRLGKKHTEASKRKMSKSQKGKKRTEVIKQKMSDSRRGVSFSPKTRRNMATAQRRRRQREKENHALV